MKRKDSKKSDKYIFGTKGKKYKNESTFLTAFMKINREKLLEEYKKHNDFYKSDKDILKGIRANIVQFRTEDNYTTMKKAIKRELNTRAFKSQSEFYRESIMKNINGNDEIKYQIRELSRDERGHFGKTPDAQFHGTVTINNTQYTKYQFLNKSTGKIGFIYESNSPKADNYNIFFSQVDYK